jgi:hypothetical protein
MRHEGATVFTVKNLMGSQACYRDKIGFGVAAETPR